MDDRAVVRKMPKQTIENHIYEALIGDAQDDSGKVDWFADSPLEKHIKEIAWTNADFCGHCGGSCDGGFHMTIFGKEFNHVCNTTLQESTAWRNVTKKKQNIMTYLFEINL